MKSLTTYQPHASLIAIEAKLYETRGWETKYRGPLANHAGALDPVPTFLRLPMDTKIAIESVLGEHLERPWVGGSLLCGYLPRGYIISTGILTDCKQVKGTCLRDDDTAKILFVDGTVDTVPAHELMFGDFSPGRWAWRIRDTVMLPEPIPAKGRQGLWTWEGVA